MVYSVYEQNPNPYAIDGSYSDDLVVLQAGFGTADSSPPTGYRFQISIVPTSSYVGGGNYTEEIYAIDIGYLVLSEEGDVDP